MTSKWSLTIEGNTKPVKDALRTSGWRWEPENQCWRLRITDQQAEQVRTDGDLLKRLHGRKQGCQVRLGYDHTTGVVVWTSKTYQGAGAVRDPDGMGWDCDAAGNRVGGQRIPGSDPTDTI